MFDLIKYSSVYWKMDCDVLMDGYNVFREWILEHTELDVYSFITVQPLASSFMLKSGCYDNVHQLSSFIQQCNTKCVIGGRIMTNSSLQYHVKMMRAGFDACNLYPSAMYFMLSFVMGMAKVLTDTSHEKQDCYHNSNYKLNEHLNFRLTNKTGENGVRNFTNDMGKGIVYIDKIGLEDLITFHDAQFKTIDGYYLNEGRKILLTMLLGSCTV